MAAFVLLVIFVFVQIRSGMLMLSPVEKPSAQVLLENKVCTSYK